MFVAGVDGTGEGWVAVALEDGSFAGAARFSSVQSLLEALPEARAVAVNLPVALLERGARLCDAQAQDLLGARGEAIVAMPPRAVLQTQDLERAKVLAGQLTSEPLSTRAHALRDKILELDRVLRADPTLSSAPPPSSGGTPPASESAHPSQRIAAKRESRESLLRYARIVPRDHGATVKQALLVPAVGEAASATGPRPAGRIVEAQPELCFRELAGEPLAEPSHSPGGRATRRHLLERAGIVIPDTTGAVGGVPLDQVMCAATMSWTAHRYARGRARSLPARAAWQRDGDRVVAIWI